MNWPLPIGAHLLAPFDHQVAGQSSMLRYDASTVCKPLIAREHFVYQTLPDSLKEFTPDYRGELEVGLAEKDGYLQLYGLCVKDDSNDDICQCSHQRNKWEDRLDPNGSPRENASNQVPVENTPNIHADQNRCVIRVLRSGSYEICSSPPSEATPSHPDPETPTPPVKAPSLNPWSLKNHKRLLDKMRKGKHRHNSFRCILLKNAVADFNYPCILDLKIGSRLHGDDAVPDKVKSQSRKCNETTSKSMGVRLCGMQVYQKGTGHYINLDKFQGRLLTDETFKRTLERFLHNGNRYRSELLQPIVAKLSRLIESLYKVNSYRFYASSLLIIYDGIKEGVDEKMPQKMSRVEMEKTIFDHSHDQCSKSNKSSSSRNVPKSDISSNQQRTCSNQCSSPSHTPLDSDSLLLSKPVEENCCPPDSNSIPPAGQKKDFTHIQLEDNKSSSSTSNNNHKNLHDSPSDAASFPKECRNSVCKVDVKMIDFAHTTHIGFPNDTCRHEGPDLDYIWGLTNLKTLFEDLMAEC